MAKKAPTQEESLAKIAKSFEKITAKPEEVFKGGLSGPTSFREAMTYKLTGVNEGKKELYEKKMGMDSGTASFKDVYVDELKQGFKGLFGIQDKKLLELRKKEAKEAEMAAAEIAALEEDAAKEKAAKEEARAEEQQEVIGNIDTNVEAIRDKISPKEKETQPITGLVDASGNTISSAGLTGATVTDGTESGTFKDEDDSGEKILAVMEDISDNTEAAASGGIAKSLFTVLGPVLLPVAVALASVAAALLVFKAFKEFREMREAQKEAKGAEARYERNAEQFEKKTQEEDPELFAKAKELQEADNRPEVPFAAYVGKARVALGRTPAATPSIDATPAPAVSAATAAVEEGSMAAETRPAPVVVNNVDASTQAVSTGGGGRQSTAVNIGLRDVHGSHLRFQERRMARVM